MERLKEAAIRRALNWKILPEKQHAKAWRYLMRQQAADSGLNKNIILTTGQMRSGTTMLASFLGGQQGVHIIPDALRVPVASFNYFQREVEPEDLLSKVDRIRLFWTLVRTGLRNPSTPAAERALFERWEEVGQPPIYRNQVELYLLLARELQQDLGVSGRFGTKATRGELLARSVAGYGGKAIIILRDPRAVYTSQAKRAAHDENFQGADLEQFIENWRRSYSIWQSPGRAHSLRYEDFVNDDAEIARLGDYLGMKLDPNVRIATANSSFGDKSTGARRPHVADRWKSEGDPEALARIEQELATEMKAAGY